MFALYSDGQRCDALGLFLNKLYADRVAYELSQRRGREYRVYEIGHVKDRLQRSQHND